MKNRKAPEGAKACVIKPAPRPWNFNAEDLPVKDCSDNFVCCTNSRIGSYESDRVNARHIVKCVNTHDDLIATLKTVLLAHRHDGALTTGDAHLSPAIEAAVERAIDFAENA